jgi:hypothetical protein
MQAKYHIVLSGVFSTIVYVVTKSPVTAVASFISGILIDLDHIPDYLLYKKENISIRKFFAACNENKLEKLFLILHSYEVLLLLALSAWVTRNAFIIGSVSGMTMHLIADIPANKLMPKAYFLMYRMKHGFRQEELLGNE